jgi:hypothetical protein
MLPSVIVLVCDAQERGVGAGDCLRGEKVRTGIVLIGLYGLLRTAWSYCQAGGLGTGVAGEFGRVSDAIARQLCQQAAVSVDIADSLASAARCLRRVYLFDNPRQCVIFVIDAELKVGPGRKTRSVLRRPCES